MHAITLITILLAALFSALIVAAPTFLQAPAPFTHIANSNAKRDVGGITVCTAANYSGSCVHVVYPLDQCVNLNM
jgi:hypothetical protein